MPQTQSGQNMLLKIGADPAVAVASDTYTTFGGIRSSSIANAWEVVDATTIDSAGDMEILVDAGIKSVTISGSGLINSATSHASIETASEAAVAYNYEIVVGTGTGARGTYRGKFKISALEFGSDYNGLISFSITLNSTGPVTKV